MGVFQLENKAFQIIKEFLIKKMNPSFLIVFGSIAKGNIHQDSDIDIAFFCEENNHSPYDIFLIAQELAGYLKREVDLVNLQEASTVFKAQIFTTGLVIYSKNDLLLKKQQMIALSMYARLNEERKEILEKIDQKGCIYEE